MIAVDDNICFILSLDDNLSHCIITTCGECSNPVGVTQVCADVRIFQWKSILPFYLRRYAHNS